MVAVEQSKGDGSPLFRVSPSEYGDSYKVHLLEQYKLYVDTADRVSQRRTSANNYLLTVNAFLVTLYGLASSSPSNQAWYFVVPIAGILVCIAWFALISSYRNLNTAKFMVIHELEQRLPAALFDHEWELCERGRGIVYKPLTHIEQSIPFIFMALYIILAAYTLTP